MPDRGRIVPWLALAAELGHLTAAWTEALSWPLISGFHVLIGCFWGFLFAGLRKPRPRVRTIRFAMFLAVSLPLLYVLTRTVGLPTYLTFTRLGVDPVGAVVTAVEVALAGLLFARPGRSRRDPRAATGRTPAAAVAGQPDDDKEPATRAAT